MKKTMICLILVFALVLCAVAATAETMVGGWEIQEAGPVPEEAIAALEKATEQMVGAEYTPVALLGTQVVAGINYCILCQVKPVVPDAVPAWALVYVYAGVDGSAEILNVYELYIDKHVQ